MALVTIAGLWFSYSCSAKQKARPCPSQVSVVSRTEHECVHGGVVSGESEVGVREGKEGRSLRCTRFSISGGGLCVCCV